MSSDNLPEYPSCPSSCRVPEISLFGSLGRGATLKKGRIAVLDKEAMSLRHDIHWDYNVNHECEMHM
jgi:hypothetical protein